MFNLNEQEDVNSYAVRPLCFHNSGCVTRPLHPKARACQNTSFAHCSILVFRTRMRKRQPGGSQIAKWIKTLVYRFACSEATDAVRVACDTSVYWPVQRLHFHVSQ